MREKIKKASVLVSFYFDFKINVPIFKCQIRLKAYYKVTYQFLPIFPLPCLMISETITLIISAVSFGIYLTSYV